ncbi:unnamed protein product [Cylicostephanus goldi]|uniref:Uncharacterized protein n=1 Tax=Cylicostephanus goldi TaxID=71465 RepID=A0A3P6UJ37_CYLGO|nr:unnamed protein product [Cylicostephanus goldi]
MLKLIRDAKPPRKPKQRVTSAEPSDLPPKKR